MQELDPKRNFYYISTKETTNVTKAVKTIAHFEQKLGLYFYLGEGNYVKVQICFSVRWQETCWLSLKSCRKQQDARINMCHVSLLSEQHFKVPKKKRLTLNLMHGNNFLPK